MVDPRAKVVFNVRVDYACASGLYFTDQLFIYLFIKITLINYRKVYYKQASSFFLMLSLELFFSVPSKNCCFEI